MSLKKILFIGFIIRLAVIIIFLPLKNFDLLAYQAVGTATIHGLNIYPFPAVIYHPYFPLMLYLEALATFFGRYQIFFLKLFFTIFDTGIIYLLFLLGRQAKIFVSSDLGIPRQRRGRAPSGVEKRDIELASKIAIIYALNPISIFITCIQGQFDSIPLFFLLLGIYLQPRGLEILSLSSISLAITLKTWPVFFLFPIVRRLKNKARVLILATVPLLSLVLYSYFFKINVLIILKTILWYRAVWGVWGLSLLYKMIIGHETLALINRTTLIFVFLFFLYSLFLKRKNISREITALLLLFFIFTPVFGIQWLMWLPPFLLLTKVKGRNIFFALATLYIAASYFSSTLVNTVEITKLLGIATWLWVIAMFYFTFPVSSKRHAID